MAEELQVLDALEHRFPLGVQFRRHFLELDACERGTDRAAVFAEQAVELGDVRVGD